MKLPDDPVIWIVGLVLLAAVLIVALLKADRLIIETDPFKVRFKSKPSKNESSAEQTTARAKSSVTVAEGLQVKDSEIANIVGMEGGEAPEGVNVKVANGATIKNSKVAKIAGVTNQSDKDNKNDPTA